jgi:hypothetical protein
MSAVTKWIQADAVRFNAKIKDQSRNPLIIAKGTTQRMRIGLFENSALDDLSSFASVTVEFKPLGSNENTTALARQVLSSNDINTLLTSPQWSNFSESHLDFEFTSGETNNLTIGDVLLIIWGTTSDNPAKKKTWLSTTVTVIEDAGGETTTAPTPVDSFYTDTETDALLANKASQADMTQAESDITALQSSKADQTDMTQVEADLSTIQGGTATADGRILQNEADILSLQTSQASGRVAYSTHAALIADTGQADGTIGEVGAIESDASLRGAYQWDDSSSQWVKDDSDFAGRAAVLERDSGEIKTQFGQIEDVRGMPTITSGASTASAGFTFILNDYAVGEGFLKSVELEAATTGTIKVKILSKSGSDFTVQSEKELTISTAGQQTLTVELPINDGEFVAFYSSSAMFKYSTGTKNYDFTYNGDLTGTQTAISNGSANILRLNYTVRVLQNSRTKIMSSFVNGAFDPGFEALQDLSNASTGEGPFTQSRLNGLGMHHGKYTIPNGGSPQVRFLHPLSGVDSKFGFIEFYLYNVDSEFDNIILQTQTNGGTSIDILQDKLFYESFDTDTVRRYYVFFKSGTGIERLNFQLQTTRPNLSSSCYVTGFKMAFSDTRFNGFESTYYGWLNEESLKSTYFNTFTNTYIVFPGQEIQDVFDAADSSKHVILYLAPGEHSINPRLLQAADYANDKSDRYAQLHIERSNVTVIFMPGARLKCPDGFNTEIDQPIVVWNQSPVLIDASDADLEARYAGGGSFSGDIEGDERSIFIQISAGTGTGGVDRWRWQHFRKSSPVWSAYADISAGAWVAVSNNIEIKFTAETGHTNGIQATLGNGGDQVVGIKVGSASGYNGSVIDNVLIKSMVPHQGIIDSNMTNNIHAEEATGDLCTPVLFHGNVTNSKCVDMLLVDCQRPGMIYGDNDGTHNPDGSTTGGTDYNCYDVVFENCRAPSAQEAYITGFPAHPGYNYRCGFPKCYIKSEKASYEPNHRSIDAIYTDIVAEHADPSDAGPVVDVRRGPKRTKIGVTRINAITAKILVGESSPAGWPTAENTEVLYAIDQEFLELGRGSSVVDGTNQSSAKGARNYVRGQNHHLDGGDFSGIIGGRDCVNGPNAHCSHPHGRGNKPLYFGEIGQAPGYTSVDGNGHSEGGIDIRRICFGSIVPSGTAGAAYTLGYDNTDSLAIGSLTGFDIPQNCVITAQYFASALAIDNSESAHIIGWVKITRGTGNPSVSKNALR